MYCKRIFGSKRNLSAAQWLGILRYKGVVPGVNKLLNISITAGVLGRAALGEQQYRKKGDHL